PPRFGGAHLLVALGIEPGLDGGYLPFQLGLPFGLGGAAEAGLLRLPALAYGGDASRLVDLPFRAGVGQAAPSRRFPLGAGGRQALSLLAAPALALLVEQRVDINRRRSVRAGTHGLLGAPARLDGGHLLLVPAGKPSLGSRDLALDLRLPLGLERG